MHSLLKELSGGDRKSIGKAEAVAGEVIANPGLVSVLLAGVLDSDMIVRARSAVALKYVALKAPVLVQPYKSEILAEMPSVYQWEVREQFCILLPYLNLDKSEIRAVKKVLLGFLDYYSSIVKTCAMQALTDLAVIEPALLPEVKPLIENLAVNGTAAMRARARKLLKILQKMENV